ncbi:MAG TPA: lytic transglycosylase domain-containing protein [Candidatus Binatia bacterium]|nr:lytic transglycosylase domain-containing protein [Candidatus Binatia bacterium]
MLIRKLKSVPGAIALFMLAMISMAAAKQPGYVFNYITNQNHNTSDSIVVAPPPICLNAEAERYAKDYAKKNSYTLNVVSGRRAQYFPIMESVLEKNGLPVELKYLAVVESNLTNKNKSRVGAAGPWQLMPVTAKTMGLKVGGKYDERTNIHKSTAAAAKYLKMLDKMFKGDWLLVLAAYNSGPGTVFKAIKRSGSRNFWRLQHFLPLETRNHVKRYIAVHYYFEGGAGITTQTKAELELHNQVVEQFWAAQKDSLSELDEIITTKNLAVE